MKAARSQQLVWLAQAALIVLPVVGLSVAALHFNREDRAAIEQEAKDRAASIAPEAARRIGEEISAFLAESRKKGLLREGRIVNGQGIAMPDYPRWPVPPDWVSRLNWREAQLWHTAQDAIFQHSGAGINGTLAALAAPGTLAPVRANARLNLLIAEEPYGDPAALIRKALAVTEQYPTEVTESGTPVGDLALLLALRHVAMGDFPTNLSTAIEKRISLHPSFLSTYLLDAAAGTVSTDAGRWQVERLRGDWLRHEAERENTRVLMRAILPRLTWQRTMNPARSSRYPGPTALPVGGASQDISLALCAPYSWGWQVTLVRSILVRRAIQANLPDYMGASIDVPDAGFFDHGRLDLGERRSAKPVPLASVRGSFFLDARYPFQLSLDLRNPYLLYAPYRRRVLLTQSLIVSALAAALLGLWRLWHTYRDQMRLNEMKSNLVSSVSHELRAPIAAVRLMAESLENGRAGTAERQTSYHRLIVRECSRLSSLVENVLDFSRIDQGRKQYHFEPLDALALLRHTVMLLEPGAAERGVRLRLIEHSPDFEYLRPSWDSQAVEQSLVNLIDNAIKHSPPDADVRVELELLPAAIRFWVADKGPGIPAEEHQKIFDLFYRCGSELRRETEGTGIGLSIVKHVAEAHRGRVLVESHPGHGSRFGLELPL